MRRSPAATWAATSAPTSSWRCGCLRLLACEQSIISCSRRPAARRRAQAAATSAALYLRNRDNPCYDELEDWDKDTHWHIFVGSEESPCTEQLHLRLPKIWEIGAMASIAERSMGAYLDAIEKQYVDGKKYVKEIAKIIANMFSMDVIPYAVEPLFETYALNRNRFTNRQIENQGMQSRLPYARYSPYTNRIFVEIGEQTRNWPLWAQELVSPAKLEALYRGYLNTFGLYGLMLADETLFEAQTPERRPDQYPILRRFIQTGPKRTRHETEFWDMLNEMRQVHNTATFMAKQERADLFLELEGKPDQEYYRELEAVEDQLSKIRGEMEIVYTSPAFSREEKRKQLDALATEYGTIIKEVMKDIELTKEATRVR